MSGQFPSQKLLYILQSKVLGMMHPRQLDQQHVQLELRLLEVQKSELVLRVFLRVSSSTFQLPQLGSHLVRVEKYNFKATAVCHEGEQWFNLW
jgi:hypothetical protein